MKLPERLYVKIERPTKDEEYFVACEHTEDIAEMGEKIEVGEYKLVRRVKLKTLIRIE